MEPMVLSQVCVIGEWVVERRSGGPWTGHYTVLDMKRNGQWPGRITNPAINVGKLMQRAVLVSKLRDG